MLIIIGIVLIIIGIFILINKVYSGKYRVCFGGSSSSYMGIAAGQLVKEITTIITSLDITTSNTVPIIAITTTKGTTTTTITP